MSVLIPVDLCYDPGSSKWHIDTKEQRFTNHQTFYWGAPPTSVNMRVHNDFSILPGVLPMKVMVALGKRSILGPLVGILSAENEDGSLKGNFNNYKDIMEAGQKIGGIVFAFTPSSVNWEKRSIQGSIFDKLNKQWVTCSFPFPNVVYNRIQDRAHENIESSQSCIQRFLSQPAISLYNRGFFNKEEIIAALSKSAKINKNIPETIALQSQKDLVTMLERHSALYLKPIDARLGSGIIRVKKSQAKKAYIMHYYADDKQLKQYTAYNIRRLWKKIKKQRISSSYIVQQAVPLAHVSTCPFDCRVLVQKNRQGLWQLSGLGIRIAAHSQSITTHIPRGGRIGTAKNVLQQVFPQLNHKHIIKKVERLCIDVAERLEQHYHHLGEMSIDIGLDDNGKPWIFEANAKPMRFDEPEIREKQVGQVIFYAQFLTFNTSSRGH